MKTFEASRLSDGNKVFPAKINIDDFGVTLKIPGLLGGKEKTLSYHQVSSISIDTPMVGYSKITFDTLGFDRIVATGFSKADAQEVKNLVQLGIQSARSGGGNQGNGGGSALSEKLAAAEAAKAQAEAVKAEIDAKKRTEADASNDQFFDSIKKLFLGKKNKAAKELHSQLEEIEADIRVAISKGDKDEAGKLIRQLKHDSNLFVPKTNTSYNQYWTTKREECLSKL